MSITLRLQPVTRANFSAVVGLTVTPEQAQFVAPNLYSMAEAAIEPTWTPLAIYAGDDVIGFALFGHYHEPRRWWIMRYMIDAKHQGRGYGTAALRLLIDLMVERHGCGEIFLSYVPGNDFAERLYTRIGFALTGEVDGGEVVARLGLGDQR